MSYFSSLLGNIRFYILVVGVSFSLAVYAWAVITIPEGSLQIIRLTQIYALTAMVFLYLALLAGPFCYTFKSFPFKAPYLKARRAIGVCAFYFALLHACFAFFGQLGGFAGLFFLSNKYLFAISLSFTALVILFLMVATSFDYVIEKMTFPRWKFLQQFVYLAGILILIHGLLLGTHFSNLSDVIPQITFVALTFLLLLEAPRFDKLLARFITIPNFGLSFVILSVLLGVIFFTVVSPIITTQDGGISFDIHGAHKRLAQQALQQSQQNPLSNNNNLAAFPGLNGDKNKRYTVSISTAPVHPQPNQDVTIHFTVYDASTGNKVEYFRLLYEKPMHFIIANSALTDFRHIHPKQEKDNFVITTQFPEDDLYHLYISFQPFGGIEQQVAFTLPVGTVPDKLTLSQSRPDTNQAKTFGTYSVSVKTQDALTASDMSIGKQTITFTVNDAKTGKGITNLKPYLASFGHLTMINQKTFDFIHVHPYNLKAPPPNANGGPTVDFLPIGIYGPFKPGIYRAFAEFNPEGKLFTADFTMEVK